MWTYYLRYFVNWLYFTWRCPVLWRNGVQLGMVALVTRCGHWWWSGPLEAVPVKPAELLTARYVRGV